MMLMSFWRELDPKRNEQLILDQVRHEYELVFPPYLSTLTLVHHTPGTRRGEPREHRCRTFIFLIR